MFPWIQKQIRPTTVQLWFANVSAPKGPTGIVTFLDSGTILGTAVTNQSGLATLRVGTLGSGFHSFTASFAGASEFAPGASPALYDQWPETGPDSR